MELFLAADVPASPVILSDAELLATEHVRVRKMVVETEHPDYGTVRSLRPPFLTGTHAFEVLYPPPLLGEHTDAILGELGYSDDAIAKLRDAEVIASPLSHPI